jgi:hypothetical protein
MHFDTPRPDRNNSRKSLALAAQIYYPEKTKEWDQNKYRWEVDREEVLGKEDH